jgi:hypothetical protein
MKIDGQARDEARSRFANAVKACLTPTPIEKPVREFALKAEAFNDEDGVLIMALSKANVYDRENERALLPALKAATWRLCMNGGPKDGFNFNHDQAVKAEMVGCYFDYDTERAIVHLRPERDIYEAAKKGKIVGLSWEGPYQLEESR